MVTKIQQWRLPSSFGLHKAVAAACVFTFVTPLCHADEYLYRYKNDDGVKVINHTIPPEFAQQGYEVLSLTGQLIRRVEAAPTEGELAQEFNDRVIREKYEVLRRRYASANDIEAAKMRRLKNLDTNITIIRGNISSINTQIENLMNQAADAERAGRAVPANLLRQLTDARAELGVAENSLSTRLKEYDNVAARFDKELAAFIKGSELVANEKIN